MSAECALLPGLVSAAVGGDCCIAAAALAVAGTINGGAGQLLDSCPDNAVCESPPNDVDNCEYHEFMPTENMLGWSINEMCCNGDACHNSFIATLQADTEYSNATSAVQVINAGMEDVCADVDCGELAWELPLQNVTAAGATTGYGEGENGCSATADTSSFELGPRGRNCPRGQEVLDASDCEDYATNEGFNYRGTINKKNLPRGCFKTRRRDVWLNVASKTNYKVRKNANPVCDSGATIDYFKAQEGRNCKHGKVVQTAADCEEAADQLGLVFKGTLRKRFFRRPGGCFMKSRRPWFNPKVSAIQSRKYGKFTGLCTAD